MQPKKFKAEQQAASAAEAEAAPTQSLEDIKQSLDK